MSPSQLSEGEQLVYRAYAESQGEAAAQGWLRTYLKGRNGNLTVFGEARTEAGFAARALADLLERARNREVFGQEAIDLAAALIGDEWRRRLGRAYTLVLFFVKGALEAGLRPGDEDENAYHAFSTDKALGVYCALLADQDRSYNEKTIRRWLRPDAPHAAALRCWLGWRCWYTDTLREYRTGEGFDTGKSRGPVIGGRLFRVRLSPLADVSEERLAHCTRERPSVINPLQVELKKPWRDLEMDRHEGRTWQHGPNSVDLSFVDVHIDKGRTKDSYSGGILYSDNSKTDSEAFPRAHVLHQNYIYPDIQTLEGAAKLRRDVQGAADWLMYCIEGSKIEPERKQTLQKRYLHAVWTALKAKRFGGSNQGLELLIEAKRLALELRRSHRAHTIRDVPAYVWHAIERRGFEELRRDYGGFERGRYQRVFSPGIARGLGIA